MPHPGEYLRLHPLQLHRCAKTKKYGPNERIKIPGKKLSNKEIANLSGAAFKTLVIRMLTELVESGRKLEEEVKAMQSEIKENVPGTNSDGKEIVTQINSVDQKEERNIQPKE